MHPWDIERLTVRDFTIYVENARAIAEATQIQE